MIGTVLRRAFWDLYDGFYPLLLANFLQVIATTLAIAAAYSAIAFAAVTPQLFVLAVGIAHLFVLPPLLALWFSMTVPLCERVSRDEEASLRMLWEGVRDAFPRLFRYAAVLGAALGAIVSAVLFYIRFGHAVLPAPLAMTLAGLFILLGMLTGVSMLHGLGLAARRALPLRRVLWLSLALLVARPFPTIGLASALGLLWWVGTMLKLVGPLTILFAFTGAVVNAMAGVTEEWVDSLAPRAPGESEVSASQAAVSPAPQSPRSWREKLAENPQHDEPAPLDANAPKDRYARTLRDLWRPWG